MLSALKFSTLMTDPGLADTAPMQFINEIFYLTSQPHKILLNEHKSLSLL